MSSSPVPWAARICPSCTLCCNGWLFSDVKLQRGDRRQILAQHGLSLHSRRGQDCLDQPCSGLQQDGRCRVYSDRPTRCREFECGILKGLLDQSLSEQEAQALIRKARRMGRRLDRLFRRLGQPDATKAPIRRYRSIMRSPLNLESEESSTELRGEMMLIFQSLMDFFHKHFFKMKSG